MAAHFTSGSLNTHRAFMTQIAARTQMQVLHVDYPLSPESAYPEALEALFDVYNLLLDRGVQAKDIILSGDLSAVPIWPWRWHSKYSRKVFHR